MAVRTKRARILYKLVYLLGLDSEKYMISDDRKPYTFTTAVKQTMEIFKYNYKHNPDQNYVEVENQLIQDYDDLIETISDEKLSPAIK